MAENTEKVGFIGLGLMGFPMAGNLLDAGVDLVVFNRTASRAEPLLARGGRLSRDIPDLADEVRGGIVLICVSDTPAVAEIIAALAQCDLADTLVIDMGTTAVDATRTAAKLVQSKGGSFVDAPVSGGSSGAGNGTLVIMAGGSETDIKRAAYVFEILGKSTVHIGPSGTGQVAKAANQAIVGTTLGIVGETMLLAKKAGADPRQVREALLGGFAGSRILELHGQRMIDRAFKPGGRAQTQAKDLRQSVELACSLNCNLPILNHCSNLWSAMSEKGMGDLDQSGYLAFVESCQSE